MPFCRPASHVKALELNTATNWSHTRGKARSTFYASGPKSFCQWHKSESPASASTVRSGLDRYGDRHPYNSLLFQDNLGKLAPERLNQSGF